tara:strand:+ start:677 stop:808 length:132 start_codon:yes stop_codon:yes gene_type:complete
MDWNDIVERKAVAIGGLKKRKSFFLIRNKALKNFIPRKKEKTE